MPHNITETTEYAVGDIELPDNGEGDGIESIEPAFQELMNRASLALSGVEGVLRGAEEFAVAPGGSSSSFTVTLGGVQALVLVDDAGGSYKAFIYTGSPAITEAAIEGGGNLANSTWYYVYLTNVAGVLGVEVSTIAPRASRVHKTGSGFAYQSRRYVGCFPTDSSGNPIALRAVRGVYRYRRSALTVAQLRALNGGTATSNTAVSLASLIPPHARLATIRAELAAPSGASAIDFAYLRTDGDSGAGELGMCVAPSAGLTTSLVADVETDASREIAYRCTSNDLSHTPGLTLFVDGWRE